MEASDSGRHRPAPRSLTVTVIFTLLALNAWAQVLFAVIGSGDDPLALLAMQTAIGGTAAATARASWQGQRWAAVTALLYGLATAGMLLSLQRLLGLSPESAGGLRVGAAVVLGIGVASAWYLRRLARRPPGRAAQA